MPVAARRSPWPKLIREVLGGTCVLRVVRIIVGVVLLILAAALESPLYPGHKQNAPSETCPRPWHFEAWMAVSCVLLFVFVLAGGWKQHRRKQLSDIGGGNHLLQQMDIERAMRPPTATPPAPVPGAAGGVGAAAPGTLADNLPRAQSTPNLAATQSPQTALLRQTHSQSTLALQTRTPGATNTALTLVSSSPRLPKSTPTTPGHAPSSSSSSSRAPTPRARTPSVRAPSTRTPSTSAIPELERPLPLPNPNPLIATPERAAAAPMTARNTSTATLGTMATIAPTATATTVYPDQYLSSSEKRAMRHVKLYKRFDSLADMVDSFYVVRFVLFILGHILLFMPSPKTSTTCYHSAPLLWWGVFIGLIYDWIRVSVWAIIAVVAVGLMIRNVICHLYRLFAIRMGWREPPPPPVPPTPAPSPLSTADLLRCKIVCYVPDPDDPASEDGHSIMDGDAVLPGEIDPSRLPYPAVVLASHRATCGVCQENFKPPREVARIMYKVAELRQLPCEHIFHQACVDEWLSKHSDACPYCTQSVREGLKKLDLTRSATASRVSVANASAAASRTSLPMTSRNASRASLPMSGSRSASRTSVAPPPAAMSYTSMPMTSKSRNASRASLQRGPYPSGSAASLPGASGSASASRTSLNAAASASRTSLNASASASASRTSLPYYPAVGSQSVLGLPSAGASRTSLATQSEESHSHATHVPYNVPRSTSRNSVGMNPAAGSRISYVYPATSSRTSLSLPPSPSPSPSTTPSLPPLGAGSRQSIVAQYPPSSRVSLSATASRTSLVPVPEGQSTDNVAAGDDVPPVPPVPGAIGRAL